MSAVERLAGVDVVTGVPLAAAVLERAAKALYEHGNDEGVEFFPGIPSVWEWERAGDRIQELYREWALAVLLAVAEDPEDVARREAYGAESEANAAMEAEQRYDAGGRS